MLLQGKLALITGGSQGIGRGIVDRFVAEGARLVIAQRRQVSPELEQHPSIHALQVDLANSDELPSTVDRAAELLGGLDVLVNNAGMMFERTPSETTVEEWDRMMAVNVRAPMFLSKAAVPHLVARGDGAIVNISSVEGLGSNPGHAAYSASKSAVLGLTRALAVDLGSDGIRVNAIAPGWIESGLSRGYLEDLGGAEGLRDRLNRLHPIGRTGSPSEIGDVAVFLASAQSSFLTGETIVADGGRTVKLSTPQP